MLARTGDEVDDLPGAKIASFQGIDWDPELDNYAILAGLSGTALSANQALLTGRLYPPALPLTARIVKGGLYSTQLTPTSTIKSIALKAASDPTGVGGRGLTQTINALGEVMLVVTWASGAQELVKYTP